MTKRVNERFKYFLIVLNVSGGKDIDWGCLERKEMANKMTELNFPTPLDLAAILRDFEGIAQNSNVEKSRVRRFKLERFIG